MTSIRLATGLAVLVLVLSAPATRAQSPTAVISRSCHAVGNVDPSQQTPGDSLARARAEERARRCALEQIQSLADLLDRWAPAQGSTLALDSLVSAATLNDATLFVAASRLARNRGATLPARIAGLRLFGKLLYGAGAETTLPYETPELITSTRVPCAYGAVGGPPPHSANPVATDLPAAVRDLTDQLARDRSEPVALRAIARCMRLHFPPAFVEYPPPSAIQLVSRCDMMFRVRNSSDVEARLSFTTSGSGTRGWVKVPAGGESLFVAPAKGELLLMMDGQVIRRAAVDDRPCG